MSDHKEYPPDLQAAVDERGHDHEAPICTSCGKPFSDHMGIVGTCAKLKELEESLADADAKAERIERDALKAALRDIMHIRQNYSAYQRPWDNVAGIIERALGEKDKP